MANESRVCPNVFWLLLFDSIRFSNTREPPDVGVEDQEKLSCAGWRRR
jgi:hypothetical protein